MKEISQKLNTLESEQSSSCDQDVSTIGPTAQEMKCKLQRSKYREERRMKANKYITQNNSASAPDHNESENIVYSNSAEDNKEKSVETKVMNKVNKEKHIKKGLHKHKKKKKLRKKALKLHKKDKK